MDQSVGTMASVQAKVEARTRLSGKLRVMARALWCALVLLTLATFVAGLSPYATYLHHLCLSTACDGSDQLTLSGLRGLRAWGLSLDFYVTLVLIRLIVFAGGYLLVSLVLVWRKSDDWMILLTSFSLITFAALDFNSSLVGALSSRWQWSAQILVFLGNVGFTLFFYLFPDGYFVPRWTRWFLMGAVLLWGMMSFFPSAPFNPLVRFPVLGIVLFGAVVGSLVLAQVYRYRHVSTRTQRQQTKWVVYGITVALVSFLGLTLCFGVLFPVEPLSELLPLTLVYLFLLFIPLSIGFAILRSHLWDIDFIINRTLIYGTLTVSIGGIYVLVVSSFSAAFQVSGSPVVSLLATGLVVVLFQPLHQWLQRLVNRLMYGERDEPYAVISRLGSRLETTLAPEMILPTIVETVAHALKLPYAAITFKQNETFLVVAAYGSEKGDPVYLPLVYQAEQVGELILAPRSPGENFTPADHRLLGALARQAGIAAHAVRLTTDLKRLTNDLQRSREYLITAREEERRRLRRDLHDGLGPTLGHLTLQLDGVSDLIMRDPSSALIQVAQLKVLVQGTMTDIRQLVHALRPPALDELGLVTALCEQAAQYQQVGGLQIMVETQTTLPSLPAAVEVAAYRIVLEALINVVRHAQARTCCIILAVTDGLLLDILDDGQGFLPTRKAGVGLASMRERAAELGGTCIIEARPEGGTRVHACLPLPKE